jgi:4-hydroxyphenylpyruvate dioxygenase
MTITNDNPLGLDGFAFVEFTSPEPAAMKALFEQMGFVAASTHPTKAVTRYKQGRINLLVNDEPSGQVAEFRAAHGPSASGMAFGVADVEAAYAEALKRGAVAADASKTVLGEGARVLEGIGGSMLYLVAGPEAVFSTWNAVPGAAEAEERGAVAFQLECKRVAGRGGPVAPGARGENERAERRQRRAREAANEHGSS